MNTLPRPDVLAMRAPKRDEAPEIGIAQHKALLRWHANRPMALLAADMAVHAQFPLIPCNPEGRTKVRPQRQPRGTGGAA